MRQTGIGVGVRAVIRNGSISFVADGWRSVWPNEGKRRVWYNAVRLTGASEESKAFMMLQYGETAKQEKRGESEFDIIQTTKHWG